MRSFIEDKQQNLCKMLRSMFPALTESMLCRALRQKDVRVDGVRVNSDRLLVPGNEVAVYIDDRYLFPSIPCLYQDAHLMVVNKPAGIPVTGERSVESLLRASFGEVFPVHRLDVPTSGLLVLAKTAAAKEALEAAFRERRIEKTYSCVTVGKPPKAKGHLETYLLKDSKNAFVRVVDAPGRGAVLAVTDYELMRANGPTSRVQVRIHTGRTHQIRVHMAYLGCPILGDDKYGDREANRRLGAKRLYLCASRLRFLHMPPPLDALTGRTFCADDSLNRQ